MTHADGWRTVEPKPSAETLKAFYAGEYFQQSHGTYAPDYSPTERAHRDLLARQLLFAVERRAAREAGRFLEVGCGEGWLLAAAKRAGYDSAASTSPTRAAALPSRAAGRVGTFGDAFEGLERLIEAGERSTWSPWSMCWSTCCDPEGLLQRLPRLIAPGGVCRDHRAQRLQPDPAGRPRGRRLDRDFWLAPPQHLNYFDAAR